MATALAKTLLAKFDVEQFFNATLMHRYFNDRVDHKIINRPFDLSLKKFKKFRRRAVVRYELTAAPQKIIIFCTAAADGSRKKTFEILKYFAAHHITNQQPLWYDKQLKGMFYISTEGDNLYQYIQRQKPVVDWVEKAAMKIAQIHALEPLRQLKLKKIDIKSKIDPEKVLQHFSKNWPAETKQAAAYKKLLLKKIAAVKIDRQTLCHGDFHPENVIIRQKDKSQIDIIDFTDSGLCDPAYDLGSFMQQLDFMSRIYTPAETVDQLQQIFFKTYLKNKNASSSDELIYKTTLFQILTALKSAIFFMPSLKKPKSTEINFLLQEIEILFNKLK